jgi:hypothetical protein
MKEEMGRYDVMIFSLTSVTKPFIEPIVEGAPSVLIATHWFHDRPQDSKSEDKILKISWPLVVYGSSLQQKQFSTISPSFSNRTNASR